MKSIMSFTGAGALLSGATSLGSTIYSMTQGKRDQRELMDYSSALQHKYQEASAENQFRRQMDFWNMNNAYNTPSAMRNRLEAAGLFGASLFSGGSAGQASAMANASTPGTPAPGIPSLQAATPGLAAGSQLADAALKMAQIRNLDSDSDLKSERRNTEKTSQTLQTSSAALNQVNASLGLSQIELNNLDRQIKSVSAYIQESTKDLQIDSARIAFETATQSLNNLIAQYDKIVTDTSVSAHQVDLIEAQISRLAILNSVSRVDIALKNAQVKLTSQQRTNLATLCEGIVMDNQMKRDELTSYDGEYTPSQYRAMGYYYDTTRKKWDSNMARREYKWHPIKTSVDLTLKSVDQFLDAYTKVFLKR